MKWRWIHYRARLRLWWSVRVRPSPMQREFNRGDPNGIVKAYADQILREIQDEDERTQ